MNKSNLQFWYFLIEGTIDDKTGAYGNFYTYGTDCGAALDKSFNIAKCEGINNPSVIEITRLDVIKDFEIPRNAAKIDDYSYMIPTFHTFELNKEEYSFKPPVGIAFDTNDGEFDQDLIKECFVAYDKDESKVYKFEMVVDKFNLPDIFFKCMDYINPVDAFCIYICDHWNNGIRELWASKHLTNTKLIYGFLNDYKASTIENGFVDLVIHSTNGNTNLILSEHKKIQLQTKSENVFKNLISKVTDLGYKQTKDFYNIEFGYNHWHYRPIDSLDCNDFKVLLIDNDFKNINLNISALKNQ
jgi:hypothetical protein